MTQAALFLMLSLVAAAPAAPRPFTIEVVDEQTGRGVPLVELKTVNDIRLVTDSNGIAAFGEPGLMDQAVFFNVRSHGYEFPKDGFGYRGKALAVCEGGSAQLKLKRINIAERLYRVTGGGIYRDSLLVGHSNPLRQPVLNGKVLGSDSVVNAVYQGKIYWFWGDTNRPGYPLGNFNVPGATSLLPADGGLDPKRGVDLDYFVGDDGFARAEAQMPGSGPTWIDGLVAIRDESGRERMFAGYAKIRNLLDVYERGLVEFDNITQRFKKVTTFPLDSPALLGGHPFLKVVDGVEYVYFARPYPLVRVKADPESLARPERYEAFTCLMKGSRLDTPKIDRAEDGSARYTWKTDTPALYATEQAKLIQKELLKPDEVLLALQDADTGKAVAAHGGSVYWNDSLKRWVMITVEVGGTSFLGEVWFAAADSPLGPWVYARKVVTHDNYSFYNPKQHPMLDQEGGKRIFFEGTYTHTFSSNTDATPRYDYNQVMYQLDLADPRLNLPVAVYRQDGTFVLSQSRGKDGEPAGASASVAFFALEHPGIKTVPVFARKTEGTTKLVLDANPDEADSSPMFHALPADAQNPPATTAPLYEFTSPDGKSRGYSTETTWPEPGYHRTEAAFCRVWRNPTRLGSFAHP
ncbi:hypothetical protein [Singulisphaera acidiphila]|uniref:Uncharacterized protein n=1 Tax=Singulisphaera acidiphila (strain ATCC BAA-1392 / DSM 18658 / VKM B-2454 / MOB10) TaxID=886293 RepID=L0DJL9_SINAD|nr:hypothetical protein [Singulisphaera acidiphila]AGA28856.1 hypothetical protein Sinac_4679 [Singulisphaera acidiphila DSM 18658]